jgi:mRNA interferase RelE/StbE
MYEILVLEDAESDLENLDRLLARRIVRRVEWLAEHLDEINLAPLTGELSGLFKLRVGDYRVIYRVIKSENLIVIHRIGHRREVYR